MRCQRDASAPRKRITLNVLFTTRIDDESVRYEAMEAAFWRQCLEALEERVLGG